MIIYILHLPWVSNTLIGSFYELTTPAANEYQRATIFTSKKYLKVSLKSCQSAIVAFSAVPGVTDEHTYEIEFGADNNRKVIKQKQMI